MTESHEDDLQDLFIEPDEFYEKEKAHTYQTYTLQDGERLQLRLVGHNPLWGHLLWNAGRTIAKYFEDHPGLVHGKSVLEFGAGAALPSLICALCGASKVVATDYPDTDLVDNIKYNIAHASPQLNQPSLVAEGFIWGSATDVLLSHVQNDNGFDVLILADVVFNHSEHTKLVQSIRATMNHNGTAYVWFTPYRPWLLEADLKFFKLAEEDGFVVEKMFERVLDEVLFVEDPGDETLRKTVFAYKLTRP